MSVMQGPGDGDGAGHKGKPLHHSASETPSSSLHSKENCPDGGLELGMGPQPVLSCIVVQLSWDQLSPVGQQGFP